MALKTGTWKWYKSLLLTFHQSRQSTSTADSKGVGIHHGGRSYFPNMSKAIDSHSIGTLAIWPCYPHIKRWTLIFLSVVTLISRIWWEWCTTLGQKRPCSLLLWQCLLSGSFSWDRPLESVARLWEAQTDGKAICRCSAPINRPPAVPCMGARKLPGDSSSRPLGSAPAIQVPPAKGPGICGGETKPSLLGPASVKEDWDLFVCMCPATCEQKLDRFILLRHEQNKIVVILCH